MHCDPLNVFPSTSPKLSIFRASPQLFWSLEEWHYPGLLAWGVSLCSDSYKRESLKNDQINPSAGEAAAWCVQLNPLLTTACFLAEKHMKQNVRLQPCDSARHREGIRRLRDGGKTHWKDHGRSTVRTSPEERTLQSVVQCLVRRQPFG